MASQPPSRLGRPPLVVAAAAAAAGGPHSLFQRQQQQQQPAVERDPSLPLPLPWSAFFDAVQQVHCPDRGATFNVFTAGTSGPVLLCLHGGGYTGLSWALVARQLKDSCRIAAPDLRAHGATQAADESDLSAATLAADVVALWQQMFGGGGGGGGSSAAAEAPAPQQAGLPGSAGGPPATVLVGHSMGGAIAVHAARLAGIPSLAGLVVIDVVEGTALAALPSMSAVLRKRPKRFASLQHAVDWALDTGMCKRQDAAHVSLPSALRLATSADSAAAAAAVGALGSPVCLGGLAPLAEDADDGEEAAGEQQAQPQPEQGEQQPQEQWVWRTALEATEPFWAGWYTGLSDAFLALPVPKVLVLAGTDRLDRALTIGQMQGRFQPVLLPQAGHAVHEDEPDHVAEALANFLRRFRIGEPPGNPRPAGAPPVLPLPVGPAFTAAPVPAPAIGPAQPAAAGRGRVAPRAPPPTFT